jgi:hypothetical protein
LLYPTRTRPIAIPNRRAAAVLKWSGKEGAAKDGRGSHGSKGESEKQVYETAGPGDELVFGMAPLLVLLVN